MSKPSRRALLAIGAALVIAGAVAIWLISDDSEPTAERGAQTQATDDTQTVKETPGASQPTTGTTGTPTTGTPSGSQPSGTPETESSGRAVAAKVPSVLYFGGQTLDTTSKPKAVKVRNAGGRPIKLGSVRIRRDGEYAIQDDGCGDRTLDPGKSCAVSIVFTPKSAESTIKLLRRAELVFADTGLGKSRIVRLFGYADRSG